MTCPLSMYLLRDFEERPVGKNLNKSETSQYKVCYHLLKNHGTSY